MLKRLCEDEAAFFSSSKPTAAVAVPSTLPERLTKHNAVDTASFLDKMEGLSGEQGFHARGEVFVEELTRMQQVDPASVENELRRAVEERFMEASANEPAVTAFAIMGGLVMCV